MHYLDRILINTESCDYLKKKFCIYERVAELVMPRHKMLDPPPPSKKKELNSIQNRIYFEPPSNIKMKACNFHKNDSVVFRFAFVVAYLPLPKNKKTIF